MLFSSASVDLLIILLWNSGRTAGEESDIATSLSSDPISYSRALVAGRYIEQACCLSCGAAGYCARLGECRAIVIFCFFWVVYTSPYCPFIAFVPDVVDGGLLPFLLVQGRMQPSMLCFVILLLASTRDTSVKMEEWLRSSLFASVETFILLL